MSGCLPLLLQMPIIIFLYKIIRGPLSYICGLSADEISTIKSVIGSTQIDEIQLVGEIGKYTGDGLAQFADKLARLPDMYLFGVNLSDTPSLKNISILVLVPVIAAVLTWASMALTRKWNANPATQAQNDQMNSSMKMMDLMMPAMTLWMAFSFSGMMGIYWIYQSALGILQSYLIAKAMPLPKFSEEELKEMRKAQKDAEKTQRSVAKNAPKYRSLHYIDDEDYDTLPELSTDKKADTKGEMDIPEI